MWNGTQWENYEIVKLIYYTFDILATTLLPKNWSFFPLHDIPCTTYDQLYLCSCHQAIPCKRLQHWHFLSEFPYRDFCKFDQVEQSIPWNLYLTQGESVNNNK